MKPEMKEYRTALRKLRDAAITWTNHLPCEPRDQRDSFFQKLDKDLQRAALRFAAAKTERDRVLVLEQVHERESRKARA